MEHQKLEFFIIDILKLFFSLCVVCIHAWLYTRLPAPFDYYVEKGLLRLAVPFFFVTSGFFLAAKYERYKYDSACAKDITIAYTKNLLPYLLIFNVLYILLSVSEYCVVGGGIKIVQTLFFYPVGATWFLLACIIGAWCIYFFVITKKNCLILPVASILYIFALLCNSYFFLAEHIGFDAFILAYIRIFVSARNGFFVGFLFLYIGFIVRMRFAHYYETNSLNRLKCISAIGTVITYIAYAVELMLLKNVSLLDDGALFIISPLFIYFFVLFCATFVKITTSKIWLYPRKLSTVIYLTHRPLLKIFVAVLHTLR